jgi:hypothetical protein
VAELRRDLRREWKGVGREQRDALRRISDD